jgi:hypothetical protein
LNPRARTLGIRPDADDWEIAILERFVARLAAPPDTDPQKDEAGLDSDLVSDSGPSGAGDYHIPQEPLPVK